MKLYYVVRYAREWDLWPTTRVFMARDWRDARKHADSTVKELREDKTVAWWELEERNQ
jgi:hypothetical protein